MNVFVCVHARRHASYTEQQSKHTDLLLENWFNANAQTIGNIVVIWWMCVCVCQSRDMLTHSHFTRSFGSSFVCSGSVYFCFRLLGASERENERIMFKCVRLYVSKCI